MALNDKNDWHVSLNDEFMSKELIERVTKINSLENEGIIASKSFLNGLERRQQTLQLFLNFSRGSKEFSTAKLEKEQYRIKK